MEYEIASSRFETSIGLAAAVNVIGAMCAVNVLLYFYTYEVEA